MADLNIRGIDERTIQQISMAAARRGGRGGKRSWCIQVLAAAAREELAGRNPLPKLKLCARCVRTNQEMAKAPIAKPTFSNSEAAQDVEAVRSNVFAHLLEEAANMPADPRRESATTDSDSPVSLPQTSAIEVAPRLWVGSDDDRAAALAADWSVLAAAKEPWHRGMVGYKTSSAPEGPERLAAVRDHEMALNFIDVRALGPGGTTYVSEEVLHRGVEWIEQELAAERTVLVHSKHGKGRAPFLAMLYLRKHGLLPWRAEDAAREFLKTYPAFDPGAGIRATIEAMQNEPAVQVVAS